MSELQLGKATIVYEDPEDGVVQETVDNESIVYIRDHWMVRMGTDEDDNDLMKQIPRERVHRVNRTVETFEEEAQTVRRRVGSIASELRERLPVDVGGDGRKEPTETDASDDEAQTIPVENGEK